MHRRLVLVAAGLLALAAPAAPMALAQSLGPQPQALRVGVVQNAMPCSNLTNGQAAGSAVDLWQSIAQQQGWTFTYVPIPNPNAAVDAARRGDVDLAISCLNIIAERLKKGDFSVPYKEDSLSFLSRKSSDGILTLLQRISGERILRDSIVLLFAITIVAACALWLIGRGFDHKDINSNNNFHTFFKGWMMLVMGNGIYKMGSNPATMTIITMVNICRLVVTSVFVGTTATMVFKTSTPTDVSQKDTLINALRDGIAVDSGTVSELWLKQQVRELNQPSLMANIQPMSGDTALIQALQQGKVGSIMSDSSRIRVLSQNIEEPSKYKISAKTYNLTPQSFVFGAKLSENKRDKINQLISQLRFNGDIEAIVKRWQTL
jgi:polar amino acid transport system substrate-binding protein